MNNNTLKEREENLLEKKREIEEQLEKIGSGHVDFGDDVDPDEEIEESNELTNRLGMKHMLEEQLREIEKSLEEIRE